jgi:hypothetical protein
VAYSWHLIHVHLTDMYLIGVYRPASRRMHLIGIEFMAMRLMGVGVTGMYLIPPHGQHLVQPRRSVDGKAPYPGLSP